MMTDWEHHLLVVGKKEKKILELKSKKPVSFVLILKNVTKNRMLVPTFSQKRLKKQNNNPAD